MSSLELIPVITAFLPMAMESPALTDALIAFSSSHLSAKDDSYTIISLNARSRALSRLAKDLSFEKSPFSCLEVNVAVCLILLTAEVCDGNYDAWYNHLLGAKHLITSRDDADERNERNEHSFRAFKNSAEGQWILRNFAYHDIIGSVTSSARPVIDGAYLRGIDNVVDTYLGAASPILIFISDISNIDCGHGAAGSILASWEQCLAIEQGLQGWTCPISTSLVLVSVAYAYRGAALIYLYRQMKRLHSRWRKLETPTNLGNIQHKLRMEVLRTLEHIIEIPNNDTSDSSLLFPLFLVGGEVIDCFHVDIIRVRLSFMYNKRRFSNILRAWEVLEQLWESRRSVEQGEGALDWEHIVNSQDAGLLLLT